MATNNGHEPAFSVAEVVGISAAAAAALGGVIIALGRTQANSSKSSTAVLEAMPERKELSKRAAKGKHTAEDLVHNVMSSARAHYPEARERATESADRTAELAREYGAEAAARAEAGFEKAKQQGKAFSEIFQESILPAVVQGVTSVRKTVEDQAKQADTDDLLEKSRHYADEAASQLRHAGETVTHKFQKDVLPAVSPIVKDASERAGELAEQVRDRADDARHRNDSFPGAKKVAAGKKSAQGAIQTTSQAATDTLATLIWLTIASALVYLVMLSPERRERLKSAAFDAYEQVKLLINDFKGYETEF